jgi:hypothetical protein
MGSQCLGVQLDHPASGEYKYRGQIFVCMEPPGAWRDAPGVIFESGGLYGVKKDGYVATQQQKNNNESKSKSRQASEKKRRRQTRRPGRGDAQQIPQSKIQRKQTSGQESQTGLGTKTNR